jgi:hypothetical protein
MLMVIVQPTSWAGSRKHVENKQVAFHAAYSFIDHLGTPGVTTPWVRTLGMGNFKKKMSGNLET